MKPNLAYYYRNRDEINASKQLSRNKIRANELDITLEKVVELRNMGIRGKKQTIEYLKNEAQKNSSNLVFDLK